MKTQKLFDNYNLNINEAEVTKALSEIKGKSKSLKTKENLKKILSFIDLTTLDGTDTAEKAQKFAEKVNQFNAQFPNYRNVAAICVYPALVPEVKKHLKDKNFNLASVTGGFPASQTFIDIKTAETKAVAKAGATEADMVISIGKFLSGDYDTVFDEIKSIKEACGNMHLKVIMETGVLPSLTEIKKACILALEAGGDFLKTSTGKADPAATPEAMYIMAQSVKEYYEKTYKKIGLKPAGGISDSDTAIIYFTIVKEVLGEEWLSPELFRIGASSLANKVLSDLEEKTVSYF
jgi:deoxyribose-phosphate aldolase